MGQLVLLASAWALGHRGRCSDGVAVELVLDEEVETLNPTAVYLKNPLQHFPPGCLINDKFFSISAFKHASL